MDLQKIKLQADLEQEYAELSKKETELLRQYVEPKKKNMINQAFEEFKSFVSSKGLEIKSENDLILTAVYKNFELSLKKEIYENGKFGGFYLQQNGTDHSKIEIDFTFNTKISKSRSFTAGGPDAQLSMLRQKIDYSKEVIERIPNVEYCYKITAGPNENPKEYQSFEEVLGTIIR